MWLDYKHRFAFISVCPTIVIKSDRNFDLQSSEKWKMAPAPHEIVQQPNQVALPANNQGGSISLSMLIDFIVQRTYHDITVLAEL